LVRADCEIVCGAEAASEGGAAAHPWRYVYIKIFSL